MTIKPYGERVLVQPDKEEDKTAGGIVIPDAAKKAPQRGTITGIGTEIKEKHGVKVGDRVLFGKYAGDELVIEGITTLLIPVKEILAVLG